MIGTRWGALEAVLVVMHPVAELPQLTGFVTLARIGSLKFDTVEAKLALTDETLHGLGQFRGVEANAVLEYKLNIFDVLDVLRRIARNDH